MILRRLARPLLASIFISGGINALRQAEGHAEAAKPLLDSTVGRYADKLPAQVPTDPVTLVKVDAALKIAAGSLFALGKAPRLSALVLLGSLVPTTVAGHPFWAEKDEQAKQQHLVHFLKNLGLAGGLMLAAADTHGKPSLGWRAKKAAQVASKQAQSIQKSAGKQAQTWQKTAEKQTRKARKRAKQLTN
ncbi:DoxX family protein [Amycolatopsis magusensis]|uniref:DoxX family protein n=1 Tax=Amycolatopsis magusensis TaxID=882444 RepID=UPI0024A85EB4|nr:DoxX family protein [Amycolatopsis magusensis]MDI5981433.1 DoxX family protein [Amycolatopsis magusensis]